MQRYTEKERIVAAIQTLREKHPGIKALKLAGLIFSVCPDEFKEGGEPSKSWNLYAGKYIEQMKKAEDYCDTSKAYVIK